MANDIVAWNAKVRWLAAAIYTTAYGTAMNDRTPTFEELPARIRDKWEEAAKDWLSSIEEAGRYALREEARRKPEKEKADG